MKHKGLIGVVLVLVIAIGVFALVNAKEISTLSSAGLTLKVDGEAAASMSLAEIAQLGEEEFTAVLRASGKAPQENTYTGLPLLTVLEALKPGSITAESQVSVLASDGYAVSYSGADLLRPAHIYLVWLKDGKELGTKGENGLGPLLVIPRQDEFGQYWCKYVVAVDLR